MSNEIPLSLNCDLSSLREVDAVALRAFGYGVLTGFIIMPAVIISLVVWSYIPQNVGFKKVPAKIQNQDYLCLKNKMAHRLVLDCELASEEH